jgi:hypothetical protein
MTTEERLERIENGILDLITVTRTVLDVQKLFRSVDRERLKSRNNVAAAGGAKTEYGAMRVVAGTGWR